MSRTYTTSTVHTLQIVCNYTGITTSKEYSYMKDLLEDKIKMLNEDLYDHLRSGQEIKDRISEAVLELEEWKQW